MADELYTAITQLQSAEEAKLFFADLCTPQEIHGMAERWRIAIYLKQDMSYREISAKTGVSVTTVGRVARALNYGDGGYELLLNRTEHLHTEQKS
nr:YerC/YecD family TrpR-related protein [Vibrio sinus]